MDIEITTPFLIAITIGVTEVVKRVMGESPLTSRITPLVAILVGLGLSAGAVGLNFLGLVTGLMIGLSAIGLFSGTKSVIQG